MCCVESVSSEVDPKKKTLEKVAYLGRDSRWSWQGAGEVRQEGKDTVEGVVSNRLLWVNEARCPCRTLGNRAGHTSGLTRCTSRLGLHNQVHRWGGLNHRNALSPVLGWKPEIQVSAGPGFLGRYWAGSKEPLSSFW